MKNFDLIIDGKVCMDIGVFIGGFIDCMFKNGVIKVFFIDVGYG